MTTDDIIRMAVNAGIAEATAEFYSHELAKMLAAEREECAKVCADLWCQEPEPGDARDCYDAIRARGQG